MTAEPKIVVENLRMQYGDRVIQQNLSFSISAGEVFAITGGSGCGKSTLLKHLIGLMQPAEGRILYEGNCYSGLSEKELNVYQRKFGILYQSGALWSSMTLAENVAYPLERYTDLRGRDLMALVRYKLALVGLDGFEDFYPSEISGGMRKRAGLARAMALDPDMLFFDEPSAGLDPVSSRRLDDLILRLRDTLGTTVVLVTHELESLFAIADRMIFLDAGQKTATATGNPVEMQKAPPNPQVDAFLNRRLE